MLDRLFAQDVLFFSIPAILGGAVFVLKLGLMLAGGAADVDADVDFDIDVDTPDVPSDSTEAFHLLSIQSIAALAMGFGAGGIAVRLGFDWSVQTSFICAAAFGAFMVWLIGAGMKLVYGLQSSGNVDIHDTIGRDGVVETPITQGGRGRVRVVIGDRVKEYDATCDTKSIPIHARIRVVRIDSDRTLHVTTIS